MKLATIFLTWGVALALLGVIATIVSFVEFPYLNPVPLRQDRLPSDFRSDSTLEVSDDTGTTRTSSTSIVEATTREQNLSQIRSKIHGLNFSQQYYKQLVGVVQGSHFSDKERRSYCLFLLLHTRKAPPPYCAWSIPNCTFPTLVTGLGGTGTHTAEKFLKAAGFLVEHENVRGFPAYYRLKALQLMLTLAVFADQVNRDGSVGWMYAVNDAFIGQHYPFGRFQRSVFPHLQCEVYPGELHAPRYSRVVHELRCPIHHISAFTSHDRRVYEFVWNALAYAASSDTTGEDTSASFDAEAWLAQWQRDGRVADDPRLIADIAVFMQSGLLPSQPRDNDPADEFEQRFGRGGGGGNPFAKQRSKAGASRSSVLHHVEKHHAMKERERVSNPTGFRSHGKQHRRLVEGAAHVGWLDSRTLPSEKCLPSYRDHSSLLRDVYVWGLEVDCIVRFKTVERQLICALLGCQNRKTATLPCCSSSSCMARVE